jgi:hypothetical protein
MIGSDVEAEKCFTVLSSQFAENFAEWVTVVRATALGDS